MPVVRVKRVRRDPLTPAHKARIAAALAAAPPATTRALYAVGRAVEEYRCLAADEAARPRPAQVKRQLDGVADASRQACETLHGLTEQLKRLNESAADALDELLQAQDPPANVMDFVRGSFQDAALELSWRCGNLAQAAGAFQAVGRPQKEALGIFVNQLALIWERVHGAWPGRTYSTALEMETGPFRNFVAACLDAADVADGGAPDGLIRRVLKGRQRMEKTSTV